MAISASRGLFVTGTDTGVGKTVAAVALLRGLAVAGVKAVGMKPVAAGIGPSETEHADVAALARASSVDAPLADRNAYAFAEPVAPHLAATRAGVTIRLDAIAAAYARLAARADFVVVEGAGGVLVPLNDREDMLDIARVLELPVLLVVGLRLGCLNHARLAALAIRTRRLALAGFVACRIDPAMQLADENLQWLRRALPAPLIADLTDATPGALSPDALARLGVR